jgi:hypothetical protein
VEDDWGRKGGEGSGFIGACGGADGRPRSAAAGLRLPLDDWLDLLFLEEKEGAAVAWMTMPVAFLGRREWMGAAVNTVLLCFLE